MSIETVTPAIVASAEQERIYRRFSGPPRGHFIVRARAGTGKTHTILDGIKHAPEPHILLAAFAKQNKEDFERQLTNPRAIAKTLHSVGYTCVRRYWGKVDTCNRNERAHGLTEAVCGAIAPDPVKKLVTRLHTKAREIAPLATRPDELIGLALQFDCTPDEDWVKDGFDTWWVIERALRAMVLAAQAKPPLIDFADMIFLPIRNRWLRPQFDLVVVDEAQDMTTAQLMIARGVCGGRLVLVGDDRQAIYAFRGADADSLDRLKAELHADELGLTKSYRCGKAIVALAQEIVPDIDAAPGNPEGQVSTIPYEWLAEQAQGGHFILSRVNAPLMPVAMALLRRHKPVKVRGKDIGEGLIALVKRLAEHSGHESIEALLERLTAWQAREIQRAVAAERDDLVEGIRDKAETIRVLTEGMAGVPALLAQIEDLFTETRGHPGLVLCSSVHKAKGLEADTVYILRDTLMGNSRRPAPNGGQPPPKAQTARDIREEENIKYVAITRAKNHLVWVDGLPA